MSKLANTPFKAVEYIYGIDIDNASPDFLIDAIKKAKAEIKEFKDADIDSKYITKKVEELNTAIEKMVAKLDTLD